MYQSLLALGLSLLLLPARPLQLSAQTVADPGLVAEIAKIKAIDNHAHVVRVVGAGENPDTDYDALPCDGLEASPSPVRFRPENPEYIQAWRVLYGYPYNDMSEAHLRELMETKRRVMREQGDNYPTWILDKLGIETTLANRVAMGRSVAPPRFRWVPYVDALMLPLNNDGERRVNSDRRFFYDHEERLLKQYFAQSNVPARPATLREYLTGVVTATLERQRREGAVAVKFEAAYLRPLDFSDTPENDAARIYARYAGGGQPPPNDYKALQDFLFRYIAREAGRLGLAVHVHVALGCGGYFNLGGTNPLLLESVFDDPVLRKTNFVILHGGWPFTKEVAALLSKPNVYTDFSMQTILLSPGALAEVLHSWLQLFPEKVLFGTDASPATPEVNWEETDWLATTSARQALALALTEMMRDGEITRERALELARMVMRENAARLYNFR